MRATLFTGLLAATLASLTAVGSATQIVERRPTMVPRPRGDALLRNVMMKAHNDARAAIGEAPLLWDDRLAASAAAYAALLARERRFEHARQDDGPDQQGENLWMGTRDAYDFREMVGGWTDERRFYRPVPVPDSSNTGRWADVAHYVQIVWRETTAMGCALASNRDDDVLVCRYSPAGNVAGDLPYR